MKRIAMALSLAAACAVGVAAQSSTSTSTTKTKIEVKGGKTITMVGCLEINPTGGFMVTDFGAGGRRYVLVTKEDLSKYLHHTVRVTGKAAEQGEGNIEIKSKSDVNHSQVGTTGAVDSEGLSGLPYLGVKTLKNISHSCK